MLKGRKIIVTGAGRGIGRAIALALAQEGATVGVNYLNSEEGARDLVASNPDQFRPLRFDVGDWNAVSAGVLEFVKQVGGIDGLVNNAGINKSALVLRAPIQDWTELVRVNLLGTMYCSRAVLPHMLKGGGGVILSISSVASVRPMSGQAVYAATKGGIESFSRGLAVEYGRRGIRSLVMRLGPITTEMLQAVLPQVGEALTMRSLVGRFGEPEEVAELAVYLLSGRAAYATGSVIDLEGGYLHS